MSSSHKKSSSSSSKKDGKKSSKHSEPISPRGDNKSSATSSKSSDGSSRSLKPERGIETTAAPPKSPSSSKSSSSKHSSSSSSSSKHVEPASPRTDKSSTSGTTKSTSSSSSSKSDKGSESSSKSSGHSSSHSHSSSSTHISSSSTHSSKKDSKSSHSKSSSSSSNIPVSTEESSSKTPSSSSSSLSSSSTTRSAPSSSSSSSSSHKRSSKASGKSSSTSSPAVASPPPAVSTTTPFEYPPVSLSPSDSPAPPVALAGLRISLDGFDDLTCGSKQLEIAAPLERLSIGALKDRLETHFSLPRIFIDLHSGFWMCSGQRMEGLCPFQHAFSALFELERDGFVRVAIRESASRRWSQDLERAKQRASLAEKQLFTLQTKLEEEKIKASESVAEMRRKIDRLGTAPAAGDDRDALIEQTNLLQMTLNAARESAQSRIRVLEADLIAAGAAHEVASKELQEKHAQEVVEQRRAHAHQLETASRAHQAELDEQREAARRLEDELEHLRQKLELFKSAKGTEVAQLTDRIKELEQAPHQKQRTPRDHGPDSAAASPAEGASPQDATKLAKKLQKLTDEMEEKEEEIHAKQQLLRRVRFLVDQMSCIAEQKKR